MTNVPRLVCARVTACVDTHTLYRQSYPEVKLTLRRVWGRRV
jgi:hypothetical protein